MPELVSQSLDLGEGRLGPVSAPKQGRRQVQHQALAQLRLPIVDSEPRRQLRLSMHDSMHLGKWTTVLAALSRSVMEGIDAWLAVDMKRAA